MSRFSSSAPSANIPFPAHAKITAVELLAFLPRSLHCRDVVYRLASNEFHYKAMATVINYYRAWEPDVFDARNKVSTTLISTMRAGGYEDWRLGRHSKWHKHRKLAWDSYDLNVGAFKTPLDYNGDEKDSGNLPSIAFKALAPDSGKFPEGEDALDLTRMVQYATEHSDESWAYPQDYDALLAKVSGPAKVKTSHSDFQAMMRWHPVLDQEQKTRGDNNRRKKRKERSASPLTIQIAPGRKKKKIEKAANLDVEVAHIGESEHEDGVVRSVETGRDTSCNDVQVEPDNGSACGDTVAPGQPRILAASYKRPDLLYVYPPIIKAWPSEDTEQELDEDFRLSGNLGFFPKSHAYTADAFNGPRYDPPYRLLCLIDDPKPEDISGWAENLRWAREQQRKFRLVGWTESPADMARIWEIRKNQGWISEECVAVYMKEEANENDKTDLDWRFVKAGWVNDGYVCGEKKF